MMREIKFRAWIPEEKRMFIPSSISWKNDLIWCGDVHGSTQVEMSVENSELMQYTGLRDRNGKEIYEGDILEGGESIDGEPRRWTVKYYTTQLNAGFDFGYMPHMHYCIVIGNIYENTDLLGSNKPREIP